jgi:hypothetical protein
VVAESREKWGWGRIRDQENVFLRKSLVLRRRRSLRKELKLSENLPEIKEIMSKIKRPTHVGAAQSVIT